MKKLIYLLLISTIVSCTREVDYILIDPYDKEVINYFEKVALGFSGSTTSEITRKWKEPMVVYMNDKSSPSLKNELVKVVGEINSLSTDGFEIEITTDSLISNFDILIGSAKEYYKIYPYQGDTTSTSTGNYYIYWHNKSDLFYGNMFIDQNQNNTSYHTFLLRKLLTGAIGLTNIGDSYYESIFFGGWTEVHQYQKIDRDLIRLLYHPDMQTGWSGEVLRNKLLTILLNEKD